jgi:hypothetical protein
MLQFDIRHIRHDGGESVEEVSDGGEELEIPYWRALKIGGSLNPKYPGGAAKQERLLEGEG